MRAVRLDGAPLSTVKAGAAGSEGRVSGRWARAERGGGRRSPACRGVGLSPPAHGQLGSVRGCRQLRSGPLGPICLWMHSDAIDQGPWLHGHSPFCHVKWPRKVEQE